MKWNWYSKKFLNLIIVRCRRFNFVYFQVRNRLSASSTDVIEGLQTRVIEKSTRMFTRAINLTTARFEVAINPTPIRPLSVNTWRYTGRMLWASMIVRIVMMRHPPPPLPFRDTPPSRPLIKYRDRSGTATPSPCRLRPPTIRLRDIIVLSNLKIIIVSEGL